MVTTRIPVRDLSLTTEAWPVMGDRTTLSPSVRAAREEWPVALVSMPFVSIWRPSLQLGLLKPLAESHGFPTETFNLNLEFAAQLEPGLYDTLAEHRMVTIGDWLFASAAFGPDAPDPNGFVEHFRGDLEQMLAKASATVERLVAVHDEEVPRYLDRLMETIPWGTFRVVGFTSTFQQNAPSFALAAAIKRRYPDVLTLFGGANFEADMGVEFVRSLPCIDYAISGEADLAFPQFLVALSEGRDPASVPGVLCRRNGEVSVAPPGEPFHRMDEQPIPDFSEYFDRGARLGLLKAGDGRHNIELPFESSRGCWWGAKRHCTFCGLNANTMTYRAKSAARVEQELAELTRRFHSFHFQAVDNILETSYLDDLFPRLISSGSSYRMFYEVKANLSREQVEVLHRAGVKKIQPGIESLSSHVLTLMRKGTKASTNVNLLRWCTYYGVDSGWNVLWGFPGETEDDYRQQAALMRNLVHLRPPDMAGRIWMERFSPVFTDRESFPANWMKPLTGYGYVYPEHVDLSRAAYFFEYELDRTLPDEAYEECGRVAGAWFERWQAGETPLLRLWSSPGFLQIEDTRNPEVKGTYTMEGLTAALYMACSEKPVSAGMVKQALQLDDRPEEIAEVLDDFCRQGLMMRDGNLFLALAIPAPTWLP